MKLEYKRHVCEFERLCEVYTEAETYCYRYREKTPDYFLTGRDELRDIAGQFLSIREPKQS